MGPVRPGMSPDEEAARWGDAIPDPDDGAPDDAYEPLWPDGSVRSECAPEEP